MKELLLYSTLGCHLCELAIEEIDFSMIEGDWQLKEVDIAEDIELLKAYGTRIPVLDFPAMGKQLFWPFDKVQVKRFLESH